MSMDIGLIIIIVNISLNVMVIVCGIDCVDVVYRRIIKMFGVFFVDK